MLLVRVPLEQRLLIQNSYWYIELPFVAKTLLPLSGVLLQRLALTLSFFVLLLGEGDGLFSPSLMAFSFFCVCGRGLRPLVRHARRVYPHWLRLPSQAGRATLAVTFCPSRQANLPTLTLLRQAADPHWRGPHQAGLSTLAVLLPLSLQAELPTLGGATHASQVLIRAWKH